MTDINFLQALTREAGEMQRTLADADLAASVPTCPGWTMRDLYVHTGQVHRHKTAQVRLGLVDGPPPWPDEPDGDVVAWFDEGVDEMLAVFRSADLSAPIWTWCPHEHTVEWWVRRMAHETLIHGADAAIAVGGSPVVDEALADDGVEEALFEMILGAPDWAEVAEGDTTIELAMPGRSWLLRSATFNGTSPMSGHECNDEPGLVLSESDASADLVISGSAAELDLWLWGRGDLPDDAASGDLDLIDYVRSIAAEATQ